MGHEGKDQGVKTLREAANLRGPLSFIQFTLLSVCLSVVVENILALAGPGLEYQSPQ